MVGSWSFLPSNPQYVLFSFAEMELRKEKKKTSEAIKTQLYYYGSLQLSFEGTKLPRPKIVAYLVKISVLSLLGSLWRQEASFFSVHAQIVHPIIELRGDCYFFGISFLFFHLFFFLLFIRFYSLYIIAIALIYNSIPTIVPISLWPSG